MYGTQSVSLVSSKSRHSRRMIWALMLFSTPLFLFLFLPLVILIYKAVPPSWRNGAMLLISLVFYAWGEPRFVFVVVLSSLFDYALAQHIASNGKWTRA